MIEIWKDVEGYPNYMVSSMGNVKSLNYRGNTGKEKMLKYDNNKGYNRVLLYKDGKYKKYMVHRLVAQAFIPNPNNYPIINHKNENTIDNRVENLEWCTHQYNTNYGSRSKKFAISNSIPILQFTKEGNFVKKWDSATQVQKELGFDKSGINQNLKRKTKSAYGFVWMYQKIGVFEIDVNKLKRVA